MRPTAALRLVQEGRLGLDTPVNRYLRDWKIPDNDFTAQEIALAVDRDEEGKILALQIVGGPRAIRVGG